MRRICVDLLQNPGSTRHQVMSRANPRRAADSGRCYWRRIHGDYRPKRHDEARYSVIINGLVRVTGKTSTGRLTYELTDAGREFARA